MRTAIALACIAVLIALPAYVISQEKNINTASASELQTIKKVGAKTAEKIVAERANGPFASFSDMKARVKGVGDAVVTNAEEAGWVCSPPAE